MPRDRELGPGQSSGGTHGVTRRSGRHSVLGLQQAVGNRAIGQVLARKSDRKPILQIGKLKIPVEGGNIAEWAKGEVPDALEVTSEKGRHSTELERLARERTRIESLTLTVAATGNTGEQLSLGSLAIEITNARIKAYHVDGKSESWRVADFSGVHRTKTTHKVS